MLTTWRKNLTGQIIGRKIDTAFTRGRRWWIPPGKQVIEQEDGIANVDLAIIIGIDGLFAGNGLPQEQIVRHGNSVGNLRPAIRTHVAPNE